MSEEERVVEEELRSEGHYKHHVHCPQCGALTDAEIEMGDYGMSDEETDCTEMTDYCHSCGWQSDPYYDC